MCWIFTPDLSDDGVVGDGDLKPFKGVRATFFGGVRADVGEFREKQIGATGACNNLAERHVGDALHWGET